MAALVLATGLGACGVTPGADASPVAAADPSADAVEKTSRFGDPAFEIVFDYPSELSVSDDVVFEHEVGLPAEPTVSLVLDERNMINVSRHDLPAEITPQNVASVRPDADQLVAELDPRAGLGRAVEFGGLPGFEYQLTSLQTQTESRFVMLFDGQIQYGFTCQYTGGRQGDIERACATVLESLQHTASV